MPSGDAGGAVGVGGADGAGAGLAGEGEGCAGFFGGLGLGFACGWGLEVCAGAVAVTEAAVDGVLFDTRTGLATTGAGRCELVTAGVER